MERLIVVAVLTAVIHLINTLAISVRLSGLRTRRLATAISLFNVIFLLASTANTLQGPLLSSIVEQHINVAELIAGGASGAALTGHPAYREQLAILDGQIRLVIMAAAAGTLVGAALIPLFVRIFIRAIYIFDETGSVPRMLAMLAFTPRRAYRLTGGEAGQTRRTAWRQVAARRLAIPKTFLFLNILVTGVYTVGVLAALYAGALIPDFRSTAAMLSAVVNGVATVLLATVVDPTAAAITDQAMNGERSEEDVKQMSIYLAVTRFAGTLFAQLIFLPSAELIKITTAFLA